MKCSHHGVGNVIGKAPKCEERGDENEGNEVFFFNKFVQWREIKGERLRVKGEGLKVKGEGFKVNGERLTVRGERLRVKGEWGWRLGD